MTLTPEVVCADWHGHYRLIETMLLRAGIPWYKLYYYLPLIRNLCII